MTQDIKVWNGLLILSACYIIALFFSTFWLRVGYPYDLEWMEGGMLIHGLRVLNGEGLYVQPSSDFIPFIYPPLFSWLLGLGGVIWGIDYPFGRTVSFLTTLIAGLALFKAMRIEKAGVGLSAIGFAFFISMYDETGSFYDLVRADGCLIALLAWSMVKVRQNKPIIGGLLLFIAFLTKHNAAIFGLPALWWLWSIHGQRSAVRFLLWSAVPSVLSVIILQIYTGGYFLIYLLAVPSGHPFVTQRFMWLSHHELVSGLLPSVFLGLGSCYLWVYNSRGKSWRILSAIGACLVISAYYYLSSTRQIPTINGWPRDVTICLIAFGMWVGFVMLVAPLWKLKKSDGLRFWLWTGATALFFSSVMRGHHGGYMNVLIPGAWFLSLWMGLLLHHWVSNFTNNNWIRWAIGILVVSQLWMGRWNIDKYAPTENDVLAGDKVIERLKELKGPIFAPHFPWYPVIAGHQPTTHLISLWDIDHEGGILFDDVEFIRNDISNRRFDAILSPNSRFEFGARKVYTQREPIGLRSRELMPKTGWRVRPAILMLPKE